ncbi:MAG: hypothetical protein V4760_04495, partial [Bdellovibrionota bacterium]
MKSFVNSPFTRLLTGFMRSLTVGLSVLSISFDAGATLSPSSRAILDEAVLVDGGERESKASLERLKKKPRAEVLTALRDGLTHGGPWVSISAKTARALDAKELVPELLKVAQTNEDWQLLASLENLSRETPERAAVESLFAKKISSASAPSKIVMLEAFSSAKAQLPSET